MTRTGHIRAEEFCGDLITLMIPFRGKNNRFVDQSSDSNITGKTG